MEELRNVKHQIINDQENVNIDPSVAKKLCDKFNGLQYDGRTKKRRIFAGTLVADDSWHVLGASALESYGIYHSFTFVESNRTQSFQPRPLRFVNGSDLLFTNNTKNIIQGLEKRGELYG